MASPVEDESADSPNTERTSRAALLASAPALLAYLTATLSPADLPPPEDVFSAPPRAAAVLVPLYARDDQPHVLFTRRAPTLSTHSGEISFPGGAGDRDDRDAVATALRESFEELGIIPASVTALGHLPPVFTVVSNFLIRPVVGWLGEPPATLEPNPAEVAEVIEAPLARLADPAIFHIEQWRRGGVLHPVYFYQLGAYRIWGATGRILHQLLSSLPA